MTRFTLDRRRFLGLALAAGTAFAARAKAPGTGGVSLDEATLDQMAEGMGSGRWTAEGLAKHYLARIRTLDRTTLHAVLEINPEAL
ncbi:MAG: amidase, partial [Holophaga sp.]|nr:amidase [Holophaga sp.]